MCWRLAQEIPARAAGWLPRELGPFRDRPDLAARHAERARFALVEELAAWARRKAAVTPRNLNLVFGLVDRPGTGAAVNIEARVSSPNAADESRSMMQLVQLRTQQHRTPGLLPADQAVALDWLCDHNVGGRHDYYNGLTGVAPALLMRLLERITDMPFVSWSAELAPEIAARAGVEPGGPVRLGPALARLLPMCVTRDDEVWVELRFLWPDGRERSLDEAIYLRDPGGWSPSGRVSLVLSDGCFWVMARSRRSRCSSSSPRPAGCRCRSRCAPRRSAFWLTSFPHLEALARRAHARPSGDSDRRARSPRRRLAAAARSLRAAHAPRIDVASSICPRGAGSAVRSARSRPATARRSWRRFPPLPSRRSKRRPPCWAPSRWRAAPAAGDALSAADVWLDVPDPATVAPIVAWLERTGAARGTRKAAEGADEPPTGDREVGWWMSAGRRRMEASPRSGRRVRRASSWYGSERARRLLAGSQRITPRLRIEASGVDWFTVSAEWEAEGRELTDADLAKLRAATTRFVKLDSGWVRRDVTEAFDEMRTLARRSRARARRGSAAGDALAAGRRGPRHCATLERLGADPEAVAAVRTLRERVADFAGLCRVIAPPPDFAGELRPYQQRRARLPRARASSLGAGRGPRRRHGARQDRAGAGVARAPARDASPSGGPALVVCPASVVHNWEREAERFTPGLRVLAARPAARAATRVREEIPSYDLVVTNYALLRRDVERWRAIAAARRDPRRGAEHQEPERGGDAAPRSSCDAQHRLALTGTPLENRALDLWSILLVREPRLPRHAGGVRGALRPRRRAAARAAGCSPRKLRPVLLRRLKRAGGAGAAAAHRGAPRLRAHPGPAPALPRRAARGAARWSSALERYARRRRAQQDRRSSPRSPACGRSAATRRSPAATRASARASSTRCSRCSSRCSPRGTRCWCSRSSSSASSCSQPR